MVTTDFETCQYRTEISNDYYREVVLLDRKLEAEGITPEEHEKRHDYAWRTMLHRCATLAETYNTEEPPRSSPV